MLIQSNQISISHENPVLCLILLNFAAGTLLGLFEKGEFPLLGYDIMTNDVEGAVFIQNFKVAVIRRQPLIQNLFNLDSFCAETDTPGCFFSPVSGIALNL
jgi:hypothetical protein